MGNLRRSYNTKSKLCAYRELTQEVRVEEYLGHVEEAHSRLFLTFNYVPMGFEKLGGHVMLRGVEHWTLLHVIIGFVRVC